MRDRKDKQAELNRLEQLVELTQEVRYQIGEVHSLFASETQLGRDLIDNFEETIFTAYFIYNLCYFDFSKVCLSSSIHFICNELNGKLKNRDGSQFIQWLACGKSLQSSQV